MLTYGDIHKQFIADTGLLSKSRKVYKMNYKEIMEHIKFHRERIDELSDKIHNADNTDVRKAIIDEMMWRAEEVGKLDAWLTYQTSILKPPIRKIYN